MPTEAEANVADCVRRMIESGWLSAYVQGREGGALPKRAREPMTRIAAVLWLVACGVALFVIIRTRRH